MGSLAIRSHQDEKMDAADIDSAIYARVLYDLARVNRWTLTARTVTLFLERAVADRASFSLLDVGFGHGDILRTVAAWARRRGIDATLVGIDLNDKSAQVARKATPPEFGIDYFTGDYRLFPDTFDLVISSQVAHHMTRDQLTDFLRFMEENTQIGWLVSDLHRHEFSYSGFPWLARMMRVHPIVREDGQLSIARSFRPCEWPAMLAEAGIALDRIRIIRRFPFRLCVERLHLRADRRRAGRPRDVDG